MATTTISPNMNLPIPNVGEDPGPDWATNVVACLNAVDGHTHSPAQGVLVTPDGLDINADLSFGQNNAINLRTVRYASQTAALAEPADLGCLYVVDEDLYFNDGAGNNVRITQGGTVTGSTGTITGLPSGTASASYSAGTFTFEGATSTPATMAVGPLVVGAVEVSPNKVTITPPAALAASYTVTLPAALPSATYPLAISSTGTVTASGTVLLADGSATTPSSSFAADTNTGVFRSASDTLAFSAGGSSRVTISTTAITPTIPILQADGTASAPTYSFSADTNTGFYRAGSDSIGFATNGVARATFNTEGFNTANGSASSPSYAFLNDTDTGFYRAGANQIGASVGGVNRLTLDNAGLSVTDSITAGDDLNVTNDATVGGALNADRLETDGGGAFKVALYNLGTSSATSGTMNTSHGLVLSTIRSINGGYYDSTSAVFIVDGTTGVTKFSASSTQVICSFSGASSNAKVFYAVIHYA